MREGRKPIKADAEKPDPHSLLSQFLPLFGAAGARATPALFAPRAPRAYADSSC
jgi:hypothetical protein